MSGEHKGITIVDNATEEQRNNTIIHYHPEMQIKFVPLHDTAKFVQQYMKKK